MRANSPDNRFRSGEATPAGLQAIFTLILEPASLDGYHALGIIFAQSGDLAKTEGLLKRACQIEPRQSACRQDLANVIAGLQRPFEAYLHYQAAIILQPENFLVYLNLGGLLRQTRQSKNAQKHYQRAKLLAPLDPRPRLESSVLEREKGNLLASKSALESTLALFPSEATIHDALGKTLELMGQFAGGLMHQARALSIAPSNPSGWIQRARLQLKLSLGGGALQSSLTAICIEPRNHETWMMRVAALNQAQDQVRALVICHRAHKLKPTSPHVLTSLGHLLEGMDDLERSRGFHEDAIVFEPAFPEAFMNLAHTCCRLGRFEEGLAFIQKALHLNPLLPESHLILGNALEGLERFEASLDAFNVAIRLNPAFAEAHNNRGNALRWLERLDEALNSHRSALILRPQDPLALLNCSTVLQGLGATKAALVYLDRTLQVQPEFSSARYNQSLLLLGHGDYQKGWSLYGWRWHVIGTPEERKIMSGPRWDPQNPDQRLRVWGEQGLGDQVLFSRFLREAQLAVGDIQVSVDARLIPLLSRSFPEIAFTSRDLPANPLEGLLPIGDLPGIFSLRDSPWGAHQTKAYLRSDLHRAKTIRNQLKLGPERRLCGIAWSSQRKWAGRAKSMQLHSLLPILKLSNIVFINLQYGDVTEEIAKCRAKFGVSIHEDPSIDLFDDIDGLASLIQACDFIVTTSNSTAHLAGALGKETYLIAPPEGLSLWYWTSSGSVHSQWYPTISIYRRPLGEDWSRPIHEVAADIQARHCP